MDGGRSTLRVYGLRATLPKNAAVLARPVAPVIVTMMCGISMILSHERHEVDRLLQMHRPIRHRGPDGEGFLAITSRLELIRGESPGELEAAASGAPVILSLAFRWLRIQDCDEGARQPMSTPDGRFAIAFNGEIYNFRDLRRRLEARSHRFTTHSDTEVALAAFREWGTDCFREFRGMWAMVLIDLEKRRVVVSRDRLGIKPLFVHRRAGAIDFASEAKQIVFAGSDPIAPDGRSIARYLAGLRPRPSWTFFEGIEHFPTASTAIFRLGDPVELRPETFWTLGADRFEGSYDDAVEQLDSLLRETINEHLSAEVGVGTLLSGGLDSSLVTALAAVSNGTRRSFSFVLPDAPERHLDETPFINSVAQRYSIDLQRISMDPAWVAANLDRITLAQETPVTGLPVAAQYRTHGLAAESVGVVLDGQGADELFAGYLRHRPTLVRSLAEERRWTDALRVAGLFTRSDPGFPLRLVRSEILSPLRRRILPRWNLPGWFIARELFEHDDDLDLPFDAMNRTMVRDVIFENIPTVLGITDRNSMAHSLEARVPFLDHRLVELAFSLPAELRMDDRRRKRILHSVAEPYVPEEIVERTDSLGFGTPQKRWLESDLRPLLVAAQESPWFGRSELFDARLVRREEDPRRLWMILALERWFEAFGESSV
ncbi:MAG: asparagine synthase (glutamine-hydrolyzing) [Acidobacteria bacterium]|nr:asparagine synthase (glutamine-hydrolyzing) [Acidobacteriota bacterium]